jgi:hypothetical protein
MGEKSRDFVKRHRTKLIVSGILITTGAVVKVAYGYHMKTCRDLALQALVMGFQGAISWFDEEFKGLNLRGLYTDWANAHPQEIMYI